MYFYVSLPFIHNNHTKVAFKGSNNICNKLFMFFLHSHTKPLSHFWRYQTHNIFWPGLEVRTARFFVSILYQIRQIYPRRCLVWVEWDCNSPLSHPVFEIRLKSRRIASQDSSHNFPFAAWCSGSVELWRNGSVSPLAPATEFAEWSDWVVMLKWKLNQL